MNRKRKINLVLILSVSLLLLAVGGIGFFRHMQRDQIEVFTDLNQDGKVDEADFEFLDSMFGQSCNKCKEDINRDGVVNISDYLLLSAALSDTL